ncbi:hypothetical protein FB548_2905 [Pseudoxanthomonas sp. 3HH-4]|uniref:hypothetical protein n=1 Tax=Pseudoxanthomonas sp. 3HH-4 TaxID=1690214 RepID=UPI001153E10C|nr:hypothetical protein [Pseudoxanthomonas sp. 3HH-4]TQM06534.1 hypothetical protein FB548_2905 [Pseudoxanthomonas sp. 3HH-4]
MTQNRISLRFNDDDLAAVEGAIATLEQHLTGLIGLTPDERRELTKMGDKSEAFCRQAVITLGKHPDVLPRNFDVDEYRADLAALDALRPLLTRLQRVYDRMVDSEMALGSDLMVASLEGYAHLKVAGRGDGLDTLKEALGARFNRKRRQEPEPAV